MYFLYWMLIVLCIFQDLPLANVIGEYGKSIVGILSIPILIFFISKNKKITVNKTLSTLIKLLMYLLLFDAVMLVFSFIQNNYSFTFLGENIIIKTIKIFMYYFTNLVYLITIFQIGRKLPEKQVLKPFYYTFIILFFVQIIEILTLPSAFTFLHKTWPYAYNRARLLTSESSSTTSMIFVFFTSALLYAKTFKSKFHIAFIVLMLIPFLVGTTSKSLFLMFIVSILFLCFTNKKVKLKYKILLLVLMLVGIFVLSDNVLKYFKLAFTSSTTLYTRGYTFIIALLISIVYPIGVSHSYYLMAYTNFLNKHLSAAQSLFSDFKSSELVAILSSGTDKNISAYSGVMQYGMYWGIVGNIIFLRALWKGTKNAIKRSPILYFGFTGICFCLLTTVTFDNKYEIWAFIFLLMYYNNRKEVDSL